MKKAIKSLLAGLFMVSGLLLFPASASAQCPSQGNGNAPGQGYIINQAKKDPFAASFIDRGSSELFKRTVTVSYLSNGYQITILDEPKCNGNGPQNCPPFNFITLIELDCDFNVVAIAQS